MSHSPVASVAKHSLSGLVGPRLAQVCALPLLLALAGCAPDFNWREVKPADPAVAVMLPGKPSSLTQRVRLDGQELVMSMTGARAEGIAFTVACATLPDAAPERRERVLAAMRAGMLANIAGTEERADPLTVALIDTAGATRARVPAVRVSFKGAVQARPTQMRAVFVGEATRACQAVVVGENLPDEEARLFLESLRLIAPAG
jgi:hypothetical protein